MNRIACLVTNASARLVTLLSAAVIVAQLVRHRFRIQFEEVAPVPKGKGGTSRSTPLAGLRSMRSRITTWSPVSG